QLINWVQTFANIPPGECGILVGSTGLLEIAAFNASAQTITNLSVGDPVALLF
ncbi:MAG: SAM-dependent chlorinase/fluorinase, partial [Anaerolineales bacterium]|nr:SAM-dependent chlorinase/fluorinase [Anaerolineales bacterium]